MTYASITNWRAFQHYKTRNPPWIKLHREVLSSRMWVTCDDASRVLAVACMVLASITENKIPVDHEYLKRLAFLNQTPDFAKLVAIGFIELTDDAGVPLASPPEEKEQSRDRDRAQAGACKVLASSQLKTAEDFTAFWTAYPRKVSKQDAVKAWGTTSKIRPPTAQIIEAVHKQKATADWKQDGGRFIPHPAKWLRGGGWDNDADGMNGSSATPDNGPTEWRKAREAAATAVWDAKQAGEDPFRAMQVVRDKFRDCPKWDGKDAISSGIDMAMHNTRRKVAL